jgi:cytochrome c6
MLRAVFWAPALLVALAQFALADDQAAMKIGKDVFQEPDGPPCGLCHTLKDAGSQSDIGPDLDQLKPTADKTEKAVKSGVGVMPPFPNLSEEQLKAVSLYVAAVAGK